MKETKTLAHVHAKVIAYARKLLKQAGYVIQPNLPDATGFRRHENKPGEQGLSIIMNVVGYSRRYDGWEYELSGADWKAILSIQWDEHDLGLLKFMQKNGNPNMTLTTVIEAGLTKKDSWRGSHHPGNWINREFMRNRLPYHFGFTHTEPTSKNGYPYMFRIFKRPVPIDGETVERDNTEE